MAEDLDERQARALVQQYLDITDIRGGDAWVITGVEEAGWGWVIYWTSRRAAAGHKSSAGGVYVSALTTATAVVDRDLICIAAGHGRLT